MGLYNTLELPIVCNSCGQAVTADCQFKYGNVQYNRYRLGDSLLRSESSNMGDRGRPGAPLVAVLGIPGSCPQCHGDLADHEFFVVQIRDNRIESARVFREGDSDVCDGFVVLEPAEPPVLRAAILRFARLAELCWTELQSAMPPEYTDDLRCDWQQFHWELLVEWPLQLKVKGLTLEVYDGGAETDTSRICNPESAATHRICCRPRKNNHLSEMVGPSLVEFPGLGLPLDSFCGCEPGQWPRVEPPWNCVILSPREPERAMTAGEHPLVFPISELEFLLEAIGDSYNGAP